jgi:hypothetical protein
MTAPCELCTADSYAYDGACRGCVVRETARLGRDRRVLRYREVESREGAKAAAAFRDEVLAAFRRDKRARDEANANREKV